MSDQSNKKVLAKIAETITKDEFDDLFQNTKRYEGGISGEGTLYWMLMMNTAHLGNILDIGCGSGSLLKEYPVTHAIEPNPRRFKTAKKRFPRITIRNGWSENIPFNSNYFDTVIAWGVMCFVRSIMESLVEINRVLKPSGKFIFDVNISSSMPMVQTVNPDNFVKYIELFGFTLFQRKEFGQSYHKRLALAIRKDKDFDPRRLRMPLCKGKIMNYLEERDWYL